MNTTSPQNLMQVISETPAVKIPELEFVRKKYIENYNACNREKIGELMYHRNVIHFKQAITGSKQLSESDPFSLYACFATAAVNGYSLDPNDNEVYLIARGGKACLDRQAGAYIKRLMRTNQIHYAEQAKLVYKGDVFHVENSRVVKHVESFETDIIIAGYIRMVIDENGADRFFIYRKSDWESWRKKSSNPRTIEKNGKNGTYLSESLWDNGIINGTQPEPNFLRTKIVKHAAKEKCWATGTTPITVETFAEVEVDTEDLPENVSPEFKNNILAPKPITPQLTEQAKEVVNTNFDDDDFANTPPSTNGKGHVVMNDDDF
jgi:recombinational DNA repair protein RecT